MGKIRVYATDSYLAPVATWTNGMSGSYRIEAADGPRQRLLAAYTTYNFVADKQKVVPAVEECWGLRVCFDFKKIAELRGKRIVSLEGTYVYLYSFSAYMDVGGARPRAFYTFGGPFMQYLPADMPQAGSHNLLGTAQQGSYVCTRGTGWEFVALYGGVQYCDITVGARTGPIQSRKRYMGDVQAALESHLGAHPPYVEVTYEDAPLQAASCAPQSGFINERETNRFCWAIAPAGDSLETVGGVEQKSAVMQWRQAGGAQIYTREVAGPQGWADVPANTFPDGQVQWRVQVTAGDGRQTPFSDWFTLSTRDDVILPPDALSPNSTTCDGAKPITFSWRHNSPLGTRASAFEIQADAGMGGGWMEVSGKVAGAQSQYTLRANSFASGPLAWRVRDYSSDGVASAWSEVARVSVLAAPRTPQFRGVEQGKSRPAASWTAYGQQAFQLCIQRGEALLYDSGTVFGNQMVYTAPLFLADGEYLYRLRVQNNLGLWSEWAQTLAVVSTRRRMAVALRGEPAAMGALLNFEAEVLQ